VSGHDWQAIGSAAGAVGLLLALYTFVTDRLGRRVADVELRFEQSQRVDGNGKTHTSSWLIVHNHGPRKAMNLAISFRDSDQLPADLARGASREGPLEVVWPGQEYRERLFRGFGQDLRDAEVEWSDGRLGRQRRRYLVSFELV
jgi:hypothetical protein